VRVAGFVCERDDTPGTLGMAYDGRAPSEGAVS